MSRQALDYLLLCVAASVLVAAFIVSGISGDLYSRYFGYEDSPIENATAIGLLIAGGVLLIRAFQSRANITGFALLLGLLYGLAYIWAAGEEISWGQRILGFESPEFFQENNDQQEFTFHNLVVGGVKLDESIFGPVLSSVILSYLIILPLLWPRAQWVRTLTRRMFVPVPWTHHAVFALLVTLIIPLLGESRRWEVYECIFAFLSLAIFLNPKNPVQTAQSQE